MNTVNVDKVITWKIIDDPEQIKPHYTVDPLPDGESRAELKGMDIVISADSKERLIKKFCLNFEIEAENGQKIEKNQSVFYPSSKRCNFAYVDIDRLARLSPLISEFSHYPKQRFGLEGSVIIKTEIINGENFQYISEFIPDVMTDKFGKILKKQSKRLASKKRDLAKADKSLLKRGK